MNSDAIRCYEAGSVGGTKTMNVQAGGQITFGAAPNIFHIGPLSGYMAKVPAGQTADRWDGKGAVWFKVYQEMPSGTQGGLQFASNSGFFLPFRILWLSVAFLSFLHRVDDNTTNPKT